jgi:hypothetical protein
VDGIADRHQSPLRGLHCIQSPNWWQQDTRS